MRDSLTLLALWGSAPVLMAGATWLRERHERRFPDCPTCLAQKGRSGAQKHPSERPAAAL